MAWCAPPVLRRNDRQNGDARINVGTLDHFAGMIGTGNIAPGGITLSTGTVMALATMASEATPKNTGIAMHYGFLPDTHVMLPVAESGGVDLVTGVTCKENGADVLVAGSAYFKSADKPNFVKEIEK